MPENLRTRLYPVQIASPDGPVTAVVHLPESLPSPVVVCCHGLLSYKDSSKFIDIGNRFSDEGIAVVRFDFTGCGESRAAHRESLIFSRIRDLRTVIDYVDDQGWSDGKIGLLGSSLGGYLSLIAAAAKRKTIRAVVCWAAPFDLCRIRLALTETEELKQLAPRGFPLGSPENLRDLPPVSGVLVVHGQEDETVPWQEGVEIYRRVEEPKRLLLLKTADHRLLDPRWRETAMRASLEWFQERWITHLSEQ